MDEIYLLFKETFNQIRKHNITQMAAALAYFGLFATAPIILITITILNIFLSDSQIRYDLLSNAQIALGPQVTKTIETILENNNKSSHNNIFLQIVAVSSLVFGSTTLFVQLQNTINTLWNIKSNGSKSFIDQIRTRFISFLAIIGSGIILYIFFLVSLIINLLGVYFEIFTGYNAYSAQILNFIVSFFFIIGVFTCIYKYVPNADIHWFDGLIGGTVTASLFTIGRYILTFYFNRSIMGSLFGTAGSLLIFLAWIYFSSIIFLFGAKLTQVHAERLGKGIHPR